MRPMLLLPVLLVAGGLMIAADKPDRRAQEKAENDAKIAVALKGLTKAETTDCIPLRETYSTDRIGDTILYKTGRKLIYRNDTTGGCYGLDRGDIIVTKSYTGQLCRGDIARTVDPTSHMPSGSCALGSFTAYRAK